MRKASVPVTDEKSSSVSRLASIGAKELGAGLTQTYTVKPNDTLSGIAAQFSLTTQTLIWANSITDPRSLKPESTVIIPPASGVLHTVKDGDTLLALAEKYRVEANDITSFSFNGLKNPDALVLGQQIMIPGGVKPADPPAVKVSTNPTSTSAPSPASASANRVLPAAPEPQVTGAPLQWPTYGPIYGWYGGGHKGLDISPPYGTPVYAAEGGVVVWVEYLNYGYGYNFLIDHGNGYQTLYAHLSEVLVAPGERISRGQHIGRVGTTGRVTGPHLHFEVWRNGVIINPLEVLPR